MDSLQPVSVAHKFTASWHHGGQSSNTKVLLNFSQYAAAKELILKTIMFRCKNVLYDFAPVHAKLV